LNIEGESIFDESA